MTPKQSYRITKITHHSMIEVRAVAERLERLLFQHDNCNPGAEELALGRQIKEVAEHYHMLTGEFYKRRGK